MANDICFLSATELMQAFRARTLSPVDCAAAVLDRIARVNPAVNAFFYVDEAGVRAAARASEERWMKNAPVGPLDGVPFSVKDHVLTRDMPSVWGIRGPDAAGPWLEDAPIVARLREAGAILLGKTTQPEMAMFCSGVSGRYGFARNPWDLSKTPGGSSAGAAAALAVGMGPIAVGSDAGGSIRIPAAYSGVVGHKPTFGRIPFHPTFGIGPVYGPMTRTVTDIAHVMTVVTRPDWRDIYALPPDGHVYENDLERPVRGLKIAFSDSFGYGLATADDVGGLVRTAIHTLAELGAEITEIPPFFDHNLYDALAPGMLPFLRLMMLHVAGPHVDTLLPELKVVLDRSAGVSLDECARAKAAEMQASFHMASVLKDFDFLVTPTMPTTAYDADRCYPEGAALNALGYTFDLNPFTWPFNTTLQPATSVPCGLTPAGLPAGLQIVGRRGDDAGCLALARAYERACEPMPDWPRIGDL